MPPRPRSISDLADACSTLRQLHQIHAHLLITSRLSTDTYALSRLISAASLRLNSLRYALSLFLHSPLPPNSFIFNTLIRSLPPLLSLRLYSLFLSSPSVSPGKHTFPFLLSNTSSLRIPKLTQQLHSHVVKFGLAADPYVTNSLVLSYSSSNMLADARSIFNDATTKNSTIWTTMISGYSQNNQPDEAINLFQKMVASGVEPCSATLASVLSACARTGGLEVGRWIHGLVKGRGIEVGVILGTALVDMYAKNGEVELAREVFDGMSERNVATWNAMICGAARAEGALELFREMDVRPNDVTFVGVLTACCRAGFVEVGRRVFREMEGKYGIEPKVQHYGCMVDLLGRMGRLEEAEDMVRGMKWEADVVVWGALLTACRSHGNIEMAERVVEEMLRLDPGNHGGYVVLSNMYAGVGRWDDVERLRRVMIDGGLKKIPGWSCVDGHEEGNKDTQVQVAV